MQEKFSISFSRLVKFCEDQQFKGWDPFDGLNSKVFQKLILVNKNRYIRLAWIQAFKKNPVNLRKFLSIQKDFNPKGLALFLSGYCNLYKCNPNEKYLKTINWLAERIIDLKTPGYSGSCWGYNFDWQSLAFFQPRYTPTIVASTFIGYALLDAYDITKNENYKAHAISVCDFILKDLNRTYDENGDFAFSYSPLDKTCVFNASLLGARMLSRTHSYTNNPDLLNEAGKAVAYCCKHQKSDGSWTYSPLPFHQWIDNFHTGYNLECIAEYQKYSGDHSFDKNIMAGLDYYTRNFFLPTGMPKYYNNSVFPVDIHATAQLVITLYRLRCIRKYKALTDNVLNWTIDNMQHPVNGSFFYQMNKWYIIKIPYIRWSQAWMFYAFSTYMFSHKETDEFDNRSH
ncbi:MAG: delta-aminolevulinic acid dehydratase [Bacteroidales bacterium]|nr:delta-aminolevulinic acid dehydratase [Bacteroidales bacterium]